MAVATPAVGMVVEPEEAEEVLLAVEVPLYPLIKAPIQEEHLPILATKDPPTTLLAEVVVAEVAEVAAVVMTTRANTRSRRPTAGQIPVQMTAVTADDAAAATAVSRKG